MTDKPQPYRWKKGQSGNPAGRRVELPEVRALIAVNAPKAVRLLAAIMDDKGAETRERRAAAEFLLTRFVPIPKDPGEVADMAKALETFAKAITTPSTE